MNRRARATRLLVVSALLGSMAASTAPTSFAAAEPPWPGSLPDTPSAMSIQGRGTDFDGLDVHVNQTTDLTTQAVSLTWNWPGRSTDDNTTDDARYFDGSTYGLGVNYLQIMQCWGDAVTDADSPVDAANFVAANPGPAREHCEFGGLDTANVATQGFPNILAGRTYSRTVNQVTEDPKAYGDETAYPLDAGSPPQIPFVAADGTVVKPIYSTPLGIQTYANPYYDRASTNEADANYVYPGGRGGTSFQVQNARNSRGLGCGAAKTGGTGLNRCWLVIVPRGSTDYTGKKLDPTKATSNVASTFASPVSSTVWQNRLAIPLNFQPVQTPCTPGQATYETLGSSLVSNAVLSWQAKLCGTANTTFNYTQGTDSRSRDALANNTDALQFVSDPPDPSLSTTTATYAPVTLSGLGIAFNWERSTLNNNTFVSTIGQPLGEIKLNQRLVAKLLTQSYVAANGFRTQNANSTSPPPSAYTWLRDSARPKAHHNPDWIGTDPEFLALNPDIASALSKGDVLLHSTQTGGAYLQSPLFGGDAIGKLWEWLLSDHDTRAFLAGSPDPWGMQVDPYFSTSADVNPTGVGFDPNIEEVPYPDPWQGKPGSQNCEGLPLLSMTDIIPAARDFNAVARNVQAVDVLEKYVKGANCDPNQGPIRWQANDTGLPVAPGNRQILGLTDTASGTQYGVTFASLQNAAGKYVAPTTASITAAASHLAQTGVAGVQQPELQTNADTADPAAYPLSLITYAGVTTDGMSAANCAAYATFLNYAATDGQAQGTGVGQLPRGYVPLTAALRQQTALAAKTVAQCPQEPAPADDVVPADPPLSDDTTAPADLGIDSPDDPVSDPVVAPEPAAPAAATQPAVSLATSTTKPDPSVFAYLVPIAVLVGLLALLAAPLAGVRRRRNDAPTKGS